MVRNCAIVRIYDAPRNDDGWVGTTLLSQRIAQHPGNACPTTVIASERDAIQSREERAGSLRRFQLLAMTIPSISVSSLFRGGSVTSEPGGH